MLSSALSQIIFKLKIYVCFVDTGPARRGSTGQEDIRMTSPEPANSPPRQQVVQGPTTPPRHTNTPPHQPPTSPGMPITPPRQHITSPRPPSSPTFRVRANSPEMQTMQNSFSRMMNDMETRGQAAARRKRCHFGQHPHDIPPTQGALLWHARA